MTSGVQAGAGAVAASVASTVVTVGNSSGVVWGFDAGSFGTSTLERLYSSSDQAIDLLTSNNTAGSGWDFRVSVGNTSTPSTWFSRVTVQRTDGSGTFTTYEAADATFTTGAGQAVWTWGDGSSPALNGFSPATSVITFYR